MDGASLERYKMTLPTLAKLEIARFGSDVFLTIGLCKPKLSDFHIVLQPSPGFTSCQEIINRLYNY